MHHEHWHQHCENTTGNKHGERDNSTQNGVNDVAIVVGLALALGIAQDLVELDEHGPCARNAGHVSTKDKRGDCKCKFQVRTRRSKA